MRRISAAHAQSGFTLVELMLVTGIIATLAAIALPSYSRYARKGKELNAKVALGNLYTLEKTYFLENNAYTNHLDVIGLDMSGKMYYDIGFDGFDYPPPPGNDPGNCECNRLCNNAGCTMEPSYQCMPTAMFGLDFTYRGVMTASYFQAVAHGHLDGLGNNTNEASTFVIDSDKALFEVTPADQ